MTLLDLFRLQCDGKASPEEVLQELWAVTERLDPVLRAYISRWQEIPAVTQSEPVLPIALKDNLCTRDYPTTCGSKMLMDFRPQYDATAVKKLRNAGAVFPGKTNMDEFGMGSSTENSGFFVTKNPYDITRVPGGSSGGSAVAVATGMVPAALGTDTGGSVRQPASFCALVGIRPTYGLVSRYGLVAFASSLDTIGVLARTVEDTALILSLISGKDPKDSTSRQGFTARIPEDLAISTPFTLGLVKELCEGEEVEEEVKQSLDSAVRTFENLGYKIQEVSVPHIRYALDSYYVIAPAEASSNLARYDGVKYGYREMGGGRGKKKEGEQVTLEEMYAFTRSKGFGDEVKRRILLGVFVLCSGYYEAYYQKALTLRKRIADELLEALQSCDALLTPTSPTPPFRLGERLDSPLKMYYSDMDTLPAALAGIPAISIPSGFTRSGLPIGIQFMGKPFDELTLFRISYAFQEATGLKNLMVKG